MLRFLSLYYQFNGKNKCIVSAGTFSHATIKVTKAETEAECGIYTGKREQPAKMLRGVNRPPWRSGKVDHSFKLRSGPGEKIRASSPRSHPALWFTANLFERSFAPMTTRTWKHHLRSILSNLLLPRPSSCLPPPREAGPPADPKNRPFPRRSIFACDRR
jgi:hypothetical protein